MNDRSLFVTVLEAGKSPIKRLADAVSVDTSEGPLPSVWTAVFFLSPQLVEGMRVLSGVSFIRALRPFMRAPLGPHCLPKAPPPNTITLGGRFQHKNFEGAQRVYGWSQTEIQKNKFVLPDGT